MALIVEFRGKLEQYKHKGKKLPYLISNDGRVFNINTGHELKYYQNSNNYYGVSLYDEEKKRSMFHAVHRMVAETFIPNPAQFEVVNHLDNDKTNNLLRVGNHMIVDFQSEKLRGYIPNGNDAEVIKNIYYIDNLSKKNMNMSDDELINYPNKILIWERE